jgi:hypothetical protein
MFGCGYGSDKPLYKWSRVDVALPTLELDPTCHKTSGFHLLLNLLVRCRRIRLHALEVARSFDIANLLSFRPAATATNRLGAARGVS